MRKNYIEYEDAVKLREIGFKGYTDYCITKYTEDYVYDEDPEHPESHKAGDIRVYNFTWDPKDENSNCMPLLTCDDVMQCLREEHKKYVFVKPGFENHWVFDFYDIAKNELHSYPELFESFEEAQNRAVRYVLDAILKKKKENG